MGYVRLFRWIFAHEYFCKVEEVLPEGDRGCTTGGKSGIFGDRSTSLNHLLKI